MSESTQRDMATPPRPLDTEIELAFLDDLTGVYNRRFLTRFFETEWPMVLAEHTAMTLLIVDLDHFKAVNDIYGHLSGDHVLIDVAKILKSSFRDEDFVIRYGGDEFVVLLPGAPVSEATRLAERAKEAAAKKTFVSHDNGETIEIPISFSLGVASCPTDGTSGQQVLARADDRMLEEKRSRKTHRGVSERFLSVVRGAVLGLFLLLAVAALWWRSEMPREDSLETIPAPAVLAARAQTRVQLQQEIDRLEKQQRTLMENSSVKLGSGRQRLLEAELDSLKQLIVELESREVKETAAFSGTDPKTAEVSTLEPADDPGNSAPPPFPETKTELSHKEEQEHRETADLQAESSAAKATTPPRLVNIARPRYPTAARRMRRETTVELRVLVDVEGNALSALVVGDRRGYGFDEAARRAALRSSYEAGTIDGQAAELETRIMVRFRLP